MRENMMWLEIKDAPTRPWYAGEYTLRGDFVGLAAAWGVIPVYGHNGALICDVRVSNPVTAEQRAVLDAILALGK